MSAHSPVLSALALCVAAGFAGCSAASHLREADREVYGILGAKGDRALGRRMPFEAYRLEPMKNRLRDRLLDEIKAGKQPLLELDLTKALEIAAAESREFRDRKERLYLAALSLTDQRNRYSTIFSGTGDGTVSGTGDDTSQGRASGTIGFSKILASGARVLGSFVSTYFKVFTSGGGWDVSSLLSLSITQPLLAGFGREVALEPLTQAERDVVYAIRDFERFRRTFCVDIVGEYLNILELRNNLQNQVANLKSLETNRARVEALAEAGRMPRFQVDQARQQEFAARDRTILARSRLQTAKDRFKITLGLPLETRIRLDEGVLDQLRALGVEAVELTEDDAVRIALQRRLDLRNAKERIEDAERAVRIAEQALEAGLDLSLAVEVPNEDDKGGKLRFDKLRWEAALGIDLPLNKVPERNVLRRSLIALDAARRDYELQRDRTEEAVRAALRDVEQAYRSYKIQEQAVHLAEQRVDSTLLLIDAGRASTRDYLEAEQALLESQNALTSALVDYVVSELRLLRDLELLEVGAAGLSLDLESLEQIRRDRPARGGAPAPASRRNRPAPRRAKPTSRRTKKG